MKHDLARASVVPPPQSGGYAIRQAIGPR
jgi:hypothetical protein